MEMLLTGVAPAPPRQAPQPVLQSPPPQVGVPLAWGVPTYYVQQPAQPALLVPARAPAPMQVRRLRAARACGVGACAGETLADSRSQATAIRPHKPCV